jgi:hypothetical protein
MRIKVLMLTVWNSMIYVFSYILHSKPEGPWACGQSIVYPELCLSPLPPPPYAPALPHASDPDPDPVPPNPR